MKKEKIVIIVCYLKKCSYLCPVFQDEFVKGMNRVQVPDRSRGKRRGDNAPASCTKNGQRQQSALFLFPENVYQSIFCYVVNVWHCA